MSLKKQALSGVKWTALQQVITQLIAFVVSIILARLLLPEEFGLIGMIAVFIGIGNILMDGGMASSLIRSKSLDDDDYSTVFYFNLGVSAFIYIFILILAPYIANFFHQEILTNIVRVYAITFIIQAFSVVQKTRLTKELNFKLQMQIELPALIIGGIVAISMAFLDYGVWSLVAYRLIQTSISTLLYWFRTKWHPNGKFDKQKFNKHFHFGYKLTLSGLLDTIFTNLYAIIIGKFFPVAQVGFYQRARGLQMLPVSTISTVLSKVSYPLFSQIKDDNEQLKRVYKKIMQLIIFILAPTLIVLAVLAEPLFRFLFTEKWLPAVPFFQILVVTGILYPIHAYNLNIINVKGRSDLFLKLEVVKKILIAVIVTIAINFGIYGLLFSSVITSILAFFINTHYSGKFIGYTAWEQIKDIFPIIVLSLFVGFLVYLFDIQFAEIMKYDIIRLISGGILALLVYLPTAYWLKFDSLFEILDILKNKKVNA